MGSIRNPKIPSCNLVKIMKISVLFSASVLLSAFMASAGQDGASPAPAVSVYDSVPIAFETNRGQAAPSADFVARGKGYSLLLNRRGAALALTPQSSTGASAIVRMIVEQSRAAKAEGLEPLSARANYFTGNDAAGWRRDIPMWGRVQYRDIYAGIDLVYYGNRGRLEYDFVLRPGADPSSIRLRFEGQDRIEREDDGSLSLVVGAQRIAFKKPLIYQLEGATRIDRWEVSG